MDTSLKPPPKLDSDWETISKPSDWETINPSIPEKKLDIFPGQNFASGIIDKSPAWTTGVPRETNIGVPSTPTKYPVGFFGPQEHIGGEVKPVTPHYGYGPEWDNLGIGAGVPPTGEEVPSPYAINLLDKLKEFHEAPPIIPGGGKFLGNIVDPYQPGYGQTTGARLAGIGARAAGNLASGLTTPENLAMMAAFGGAEIGAKAAPTAAQALGRAPLIRPLLKAGEKVNLLEVPQLQKVMQTYLQGQIERGANKALQVGAGGYFVGQSAAQIPNAQTPEEFVSAVMGTALGGLGAYHGLKGLRGAKDIKVPGTPVTEPSGRIILPEGWTAEVGNISRGERAMTDKVAKKLTFANEEDLNNNSIFNHEASHALINELPEKARTNLTETYIDQKQNTWQKDGHSKEYMVINNFHKEDMAIDLGNYFTHPEMVDPRVKKLFDLWFPKKGGAKAEVTEPIRDRANRGEPVIVQDENGKVKANPNFVKTEVTPPEVKPPDLITEGKPVVESPKVETPTAKPKSAPPDRRIKIHRGAETAIDVTFPDAFHKDLFVHASRLSKMGRGDKPYSNVKSVQDYLANYLKVDPKEVSKIAQDYRQQVINGTKGLADQSDFNAPRLDSGRNEFHHGLVPPKKDTITIRGKDVQSIDAAIQAKKLEGYKAVDVNAKGGIIMKWTPPEVKTPKPLTNIGPFESNVRQALQDATAGLQNLSERNRIERAKRFAMARGVKATGLEGAKQVLGSMRGKYGEVTMEPLRLTPEHADALANKIWQNTADDIPTQLHANTALLKMLDGINPVRSELEAFTKATEIETRDLFSEFYHGEAGGEAFPAVDIKHSWVTELANLPRTLQASMDLSAPFRQGIGLIHTKGWWKSWGTMVKSMGSEDFYHSAIDEIHSRPEFQNFRDATGRIQKSLAQRAGIKLTDLLNSREESMLASWAESGEFFNKKTPGISSTYKATIGRAVRGSNRAYVAFLDKLRADTFRDLIKKASDAGLDPVHNDVLLQKIGDYINNASGRGDLGSLERAAVGLNALFFSPRLIASRLQMLNPKNYIFQPAFIRRQYLKSMLGVATAWMTMAGLAKLGGAQVSLDPDNADFMKIRIGNTRLDVGGGFQQYLVLAHRLYSNQYVSSSTGKGYEMGQAFGKNTKLDAVTNFIQNKLAPIPNVTASYLGATRGQPFQVGDTAIGMFTPMFVQDLISISREDPELLWMAGMSAIGGGTSTYGNKGGGYTFIPPKNDMLIPSNARVR